MFVRSDNNLPADPVYPDTSFEALGYHVNAHGQVVSLEPPHEHFHFYITDNERANEVHKEAMHKCAREIVGKQLADMGIKELYLSGEKGSLMSTEKPCNEQPFTRILVTDPQLLRQKMDVVIIIGEQSQDLAIWAYRSLMREAGIYSASAIGLVKQLGDMDFSGLPDPCPSNNGTESTLSPPNNPTASAPGLVILNPGERLYSPQLHQTMSQATWQARHRMNALTSSYLVHEEYNSVPGHTTADEHIDTVFDAVLPKLIDSSSARLWIVGICDGCERFMEYLQAQSNGSGRKLHDFGQTIGGMAFMEPQFSVSCLRTLPGMMDKPIAAWVKSDSRPKGELIPEDEEMEATNIPTFSAGVDIDELIWPAVVEDVLGFFMGKAEEAKQHAAVTEGQ